MRLNRPAFAGGGEEGQEESCPLVYIRKVIPISRKIGGRGGEAWYNCREVGGRSADFYDVDCLAGGKANH